MEPFLELLKHPFSWGLAIGGALAIVVWRAAFMKQRLMKKEIRDLKSEIDDLNRHLNRQMKITAKGSEELEKELASLKQQNENLRVNLGALDQKAGRAELKTLKVYDRAIALMNERAPGFGPAWEGAIKEVESETRDAEGGLVKLFRKVVRPSLPSAAEKAVTSDGPEAADIEGREEVEKD
jgi:DNA-directed RNA polymerase subunit F